MTRGDAAELFARLAAEREAPETELDYRNPYTLLVAVVLSAQATDVGVNKATGPLFAVADTPRAMVALGEDRLREMIRTIGLYRKQGEERDRAEPAADRTPRRRRAAGTGRRWRRCPASAARRRTWCSTAPSANRRSPSTTHIFRLGNRTGTGARQDAARGRGTPA